ncbi:MAG: alpha/beta hydrolase [Pseudomonadota bacterium]
MADSDVLIGITLAGMGAASLPWLAEYARPARPDSATTTHAGDPGYRTHYRWLGPDDGPVAVCIHGLTTPSFVWEGFAPVLANHRYRVLLYDLYGRGLSDCPTGLQTGAYFADQLDSLLDALGVAKPVLLLGYSMGGAVATSYAASRPNRVEKVILIAPAGFGHDLGGVTRLSAGLPALGGAIMRLLYPASARRALEIDRELDCGVKNMVERQIGETRWRGFAPVVWSSIRGILNEDMAPCHRRIAELDTPTLAVWGAKDDVIPLTGRDRMTDCNPNAQNTVIEEAGHSLPYTHIGELETACLDFLT